MPRLPSTPAVEFAMIYVISNVSVLSAGLATEYGYDVQLVQRRQAKFYVYTDFGVTRLSVWG